MEQKINEINETKVVKNNPIKKILESTVVKLVDSRKIDDMELQINQIQTLYNSRFSICQKRIINGKVLWTQWTLNKSELVGKLNNLVGIENLYMSLNSFKGCRRRIVDLFSLNGFVVDLDYYNCAELKGKSPEFVINFLREKGLFAEIEPSFFSYSGNGMYLVYLIENANPQGCLKIWEKIMKTLFIRFSAYGADPQSLDSVHVFRLPGTINSKTGLIGRFIYNSDKPFRFEQEKETMRRYNISQMADILLPKLPFTKEDLKNLKDERKAKMEAQKLIREAKQEKNKGMRNNDNVKVIPLHTLHNLNYTRMKDLETLVELRQGYCVKNGVKDVKGNREFICFLYRYWACCYYKNKIKALNSMLCLNRKFAEPVEVEELINDTKNAEEAWDIWERTYDKYMSLDKVNRPQINKFFYDTGCYIYKSETLVKELEITMEEMQSLKTIIQISTEERNSRNKDYRKEWKHDFRRGNNGMTVREQAKQEKITQIEILIQTGMKQVEIAKKLGITKQCVSKYSKEIIVKEFEKNLYYVKDVC